MPTPIVSVEPEPAATEVGLTVAVAPAGVPLTARLTVPLPEVAVVEMALVALVPLPCNRLTEVGLAEMEKLFPVTVTATVVECAMLPSVPVTVTV